MRHHPEIIADIAEPIDLGDGRTVRAGSSIGIALFRGEVSRREPLFKQADNAMYQAKKGWGNTYRFYTNLIQLIAASPNLDPKMFSIAQYPLAASKKMELTTNWYKMCPSRTFSRRTPKPS